MLHGFNARLSVSFLLIVQRCVCFNLSLGNRKPLPSVEVPVSFLGNDSQSSLSTPEWQYVCGVHKPQQSINPRDFYVNSINLLKQLALKTPSETALEAPKTINSAEAQSVVISVGGGPDGQGRITRKDMTYLMFIMMETIVNEQFSKVTCAFSKLETPDETYALYKVEPLESYKAENSTEAVDSPVLVSRNAEMQTAGAAASMNDTSLGVAPILESVYNDAVALDLAGFYVSIGVGIYGLAQVDKTLTIEEVDLDRPNSKVTGRIRGARPPRYTRFLTAREVIDVLDELMRETLRRIDNEGKTYNAVTSKILDPEYPEIRIGVLTLQAVRGGVTLNDTQIFM